MQQSHPSSLAFNYSSSFKWSNDPNPSCFGSWARWGIGSFHHAVAAHAGMYATWNAMEDLVKNQEQAQWTLERMKAGHPPRATT